MRKYCILLVTFVVFVAFSMDAIGETQYKLLHSENLDLRAYKKHRGAKRSQYNIQVAQDIKDNKVREILKKAVKNLSKKRDVDALSVRLFLEQTWRPYAIADWAPGGDWSKAERGKPKSIFKISIQIFSDLRPSELSKGVKDGLSAEVRKEIYKEMSKTEALARRNAIKKYPNDYMKKIDYEDILVKKYRKETCDKYSIDESQYFKIMGEGIDNNWPN